MPTDTELFEQFGIENEGQGTGDEGYKRYVKDLELQRANFAKTGSYYENPDTTGEWGWHYVNNKYVWMKEPPKPGATKNAIIDPKAAMSDWDLANQFGVAGRTQAKDWLYTQPAAKQALETAKIGPAYNKNMGGQLPLDVANKSFGSIDEFVSEAAKWGYSVVDWKQGAQYGGVDTKTGAPIAGLGNERFTIAKQDPETGQWGNFTYIESQTNPATGEVQTHNLFNVTGEEQLAGEQLRPGKSSETLESERQAKATAERAAKYNLLQKAWKDPAFKMGYTQWGGLSNAEKEQLVMWMDEQGIPDDMWLVQDYTFLPQDWQSREFTMSLEQWKALDGETKNRIAQMLQVQGRELEDFVIQPMSQPVPAQAGASRGGPKANVDWGVSRWR